jgi:hypothetical protein
MEISGRELCFRSKPKYYIVADLALSLIATELAWEI